MQITIPATSVTRRIRASVGFSSFNGYYASLTVAEDGVGGFMLFAFARTRRGDQYGRANWDSVQRLPDYDPANPNTD